VRRRVDRHCQVAQGAHSSCNVDEPTDWQAIIPSLIGPLQYTPSPAAADHFSANLGALLCVMRTARSTGRIERWRGQILHVCGILAVNLRDRGMDSAGESTEWRSRLQAQLKEVFEELSIQCPTLQRVSSSSYRSGRADDRPSSLYCFRPMRRSSDPFSLSLERPPIMHLLIYIFFRRLLVVLSFIPIIIKTLAMVILPE
jgi:hypothetical protein